MSGVLKSFKDSKAFTNLGKRVKTAMESCHTLVATRLVFTSNGMQPEARRNVPLTSQKSSVIYKFKCHCDSRYGRTSQLLQNRIE